MDLIPYDPSHEYTVGQHTLRILHYLDQIADTRENDALARQAGEEWPDMRRVLKELGHPEQLMLAVLLHDCGKSLPGGTHMDVGAELAERVCRAIGVERERDGQCGFSGAASSANGGNFALARSEFERDD